MCRVPPAVYAVTDGPAAAGSVRASELKDDLEQQAQSPPVGCSAALENFRRSQDRDTPPTPPPPAAQQYWPSANVVKTAAVTGKLEVRSGHAAASTVGGGILN